MSEKKRRSIRIGFSIGAGKFPILSKIIQYGETFERFMTGGGWKLQPWSHVYIAWNSRWGRIRSYEARDGYVGFRSPRSIKANIVRLEEFEIDCTREEVRDGHEFMAEMCDVPYGKKHILGLLCKKIGKIIHYQLGIEKKSENLITDGDKTFICLEVAGIWLQKVKKVELDIDLEQAGVWEFYQEMCRLAEDPKTDFIRKADSVL